ncbi:hypothetical protein [Pseudomonas syringae]|uniref:hypothetical protein n=1 Tax=Pseudomonas syringae TaxID=317 RepID=UPI001BCB7A84|nr:hypothetical protein [Pseudomonas syringae]MBS7412511.1 hypothetical protein [Pseudomonas syringae]
MFLLPHTPEPHTQRHQSTDLYIKNIIWHLSFYLSRYSAGEFARYCGKFRMFAPASQPCFRLSIGSHNGIDDGFQVMAFTGHEAINN